MNIKKGKITFIILLIIFILLFDNQLTLAKEEYQIVIYGSRLCNTCNLTTDRLEKNNISYLYKDISDKENLNEFKVLTNKFKLKPTTPILYDGKKAYSYNDFKKDLNVIEKLPYKDKDSFLVDVEKNRSNIKEKINILNVLILGFVDGLNPCSLSMLIFLLSLLLNLDRNKDILLIGLLYSLGIMFSYIMIGLFLYRFIDYLKLINIKYVQSFIFSFMFIVMFFKLKDEISILIEYKEGNILAGTYLKNKDKNKIQDKLQEYVSKNKGKITIFFIAIVIGITLFLRMFYIYMSVITNISLSNNFSLAVFYIVVYSFSYTLPIIISTIITIKTKDFMKVTFKLQENKLKIIYLRIFIFLALLLFFIYKLFLFFI